MNRLLLLLSALVSVVACSPNYQIEGTTSINRLDGKMLFIKCIQNNEWQTVDSAEIVHGMFTMKGAVDSINFVYLFMNDENIMPLVIEKGNINVSIGYDNVEAKGTPLNDALYGFIKQKNSLELREDEAERKRARMILEGYNINEANEIIDKELASLSDETERYIKTFISQNYENVLGPNVFALLCSSLPYPIMTPMIEDILNGAPVSFTRHRLVKEFRTKARENMRLIEEAKRESAN